MNKIAPVTIRQIFIISLILFIGSIIFREMFPYFGGFLGAVTLYVLLHKWMKKMVNDKKWNTSLSAIILLLFSFIVIIIPVAGIIIMLGNKISDFTKNSEQFLSAAKSQLEKVEDLVGMDLNSQIDTNSITEWVTTNLQSFAGGTFNIFISLGIMGFVLYYMLTNSKDLKTSLLKYIPLGESNLIEIGQEVRSMVRANAIGIPLVAIAQGIIALIGFLIFGIQDPFFWFVIVTIGSMIPFVGTLIGILPVFLITISSGNNFQGWAILIYGIVVVGSTDNIIRLFVLQKLDEVHPLITLIGVIIGVPLFGFIGLIFGPLLVSLFLILVKIYRKEYGKDAHEKQEVKEKQL
ncbi:putative PurR-regulated permease PerM [Lacinutrix venerupis]|uniref:AI-2E family transporter n=1 Tax=Lacinutrix venerupis TaxID=1486034 RepID=UPI000EB1AD01|nr:AI-2E family transporter [Lacinutrix venerupis]RLJ64513.1 putative PurR-regulated permease PerM [Lacinutrix venerupis]